MRDNKIRENGDGGLGGPRRSAWLPSEERFSPVLGD